MRIAQNARNNDGRRVKLRDVSSQIKGAGEIFAETLSLLMLTMIKRAEGVQNDVKASYRGG